jgi:NADPH:quinone reductase-like Zn-dependent oxidoreductase
MTTTTDRTMRAVLQNRYGNSNSLRLGRVAVPVVADIGSAVTRFGIGDEVYGIAPGSFAEYAVARGSRLALEPSNLSFARSAARSPSPRR